MKPEKQIDAVLKSLGGMSRAEPSPYLFTRIENRVSKGYNKASTSVWFYRLALSLTVLLLLTNSGYLLTQFQRAYSSREVPSADFLNTGNFQIYETENTNI